MKPKDEIKRQAIIEETISIVFKKGFAGIKTALNRIFNTDMPALRQAMDDAGVPWTPGRGVPGGTDGQ